MIMELRKVTETLLRSQAAPLSCLFNPSTTTRWHVSGQQKRSAQASCRAFTSSTRRCLPRPLNTTVTTSSGPASSRTDSANSTSPPKSTTDTLAELTKGLGWTSAATAAPSQYPKTFLSAEQSRRMNPGQSSSMDILTAFNENFQKPSPAAYRASGFNINDMKMPGSSASSLSASDIDAVNQQISTTMPTIPRIPMRLNPAAGRAIYMTTRTDLTKGLRLMEMLCAKNSVRKDFQSQRFYERGGLKRKRLRRERWRKNFKASFKATIKRVNELKKQGW